MNPIGRAVAILGAVASIFAVGITSVSSAASSGLPTLTLTLNGRSVAVSGALQSGAVNVVSSVSVKHTEPVLIRLNPGVPFSAFAQAGAAINAHHGDLNYLDPYGSIVFDVSADKGTTSAQTTLQPGNYLAVDLSSSNPDPPHTTFVISQAPQPASLPKPGATISAIDFAFRGPSTLHDGELVRFQNSGFLVHPIQGIGVKNAKNRQTADRPASRRQRQGGPEARDQLPGVRRTTFTRRRPAGADHRAAGHLRPRLHPAHPGRPRTDPARHGTHDPDRQVVPDRHSDHAHLP